MQTIATPTHINLTFISKLIHLFIHSCLFTNI
jgi:hypothetical protein